MRKLGDVLASLFFTFLGIGVTIAAIKLRMGTATEPQPGFFPFLGGVALTIFSVILFVQAWRGRGIETQILGSFFRPAILILGLIVYIFILDLVGYIIATTILSAIVLQIMDTKPWWVLAAVSLVLSIGSYILFDWLLGVTLPKGMLIALL